MRWTLLLPASLVVGHHARMTEAEELHRLADLIALYVQTFGHQPPVPPFEAPATLIEAVERALKTGERIAPE